MICRKNKLNLPSRNAENLGLGLFKCILSPRAKFVAINSELLSLLGYYSESNFFRNTLTDLFANKKDKDIFLEILQRNGCVKSFEAEFEKRDGKKIWVAISAHYNAKYLEGVVQNISYKKKIISKLLMDNYFLHCLFDNIPDAIYFKDKTNRIIKVNRFYVSGTKMYENEIIGKTDFDFFPYEQAKEMEEDDNYVLKTGKSIVGKVEKTLLSNGTWNKVITTKIPMFDRNGEIIGTMGTTRDMTPYAHLEEQRVNMMINALEVLGKAMEMRDPYTFSHARHVANIAEKIAKTMGWDENRILAVKLAGELHDLGKMSIPLDILNKPGKLSALEYKLIQEHTLNCYNLIKDIKFPFPLAEMAYQHHERLDGSGYPRHLKNEEILPEARILAVSDVLEAMTHHRPYRESLGIKKACEELNQGKGAKYDPEIVEAVFSLIENHDEKEFWLGD